MSLPAYFLHLLTPFAMYLSGFLRSGPLLFVSSLKKWAAVEQGNWFGISRVGASPLSDGSPSGPV